MRALCYTVCLFLSVWTAGYADTILRDNLRQAKPGDFVVVAQSKSYTLFHIYDKGADSLTIEEITVPMVRMRQHVFPSWREWVRQNAPYHTSWILYAVDLSSGQMGRCFSVTKRSWQTLSQEYMFLPTLLNLRLTAVPANEVRKVGFPPIFGKPDLREQWQPRMVIDGEVIPNVSFVAWRTQWPQDNSELSGKAIDLYLPAAGGSFPTYFPYWLQVKGAIGKATVHIIDSGSGLTSPAKIGVGIPQNPQP